MRCSDFLGQRSEGASLEYNIYIYIFFFWGGGVFVCLSFLVVVTACLVVYLALSGCYVFGW